LALRRAKASLPGDRHERRGRAGERGDAKGLINGFQFGLHAERFPAIQGGVKDFLVMTNSNFIEIPNSEGASAELINPDDIASFDYSPAAPRGAEIAVESALTIRLKNGQRRVCRGNRAEAVREKLTGGC
jgi:hypothetical protein